MSDDTTTEAFDLTGLGALHEQDNDEPVPMVLGGPPPFPYVRQAFTLGEFRDYVAVYGFGKIPPDSIVLHHTAIPTLGQWTANEQGKTREQVKAQRLARLDAMKRYYNERLLWSAGPHLYVDDTYVLLLTPMFDPGIHAKWFNQMRDKQGHLHYSAGLEVIGDYTKQRWSDATARNVAGAVQILQKHLRTFTLDYMYPDPTKKPGMVVTGGVQKCPHPERIKWGGIASHRDANKPACPGAAITEAYYMQVLKTPVVI